MTNTVEAFKAAQAKLKSSFDTSFWCGAYNVLLVVFMFFAVIISAVGILIMETAGNFRQRVRPLADVTEQQIDETDR